MQISEKGLLLKVPVRLLYIHWLEYMPVDLYRSLAPIELLSLEFVASAVS